LNISNEVNDNGKEVFPPSIPEPPQIPVSHVPPQIPVSQVPPQIPISQVPPQIPITQVPPQIPKFEPTTPITNRSYFEKDNRGTRIENSYKANSYLYEVKNLHEKDPYLNYEFDNELNAREALLDLPFIYEAVDTGRLISTEAIWFGNYDFEKKRYFTIIGAHNLTLEIWDQANAIFIKHAGHLISGQKPSKGSPDAHQKTEETWASKATFIREWQKTQGGITYTYQNYRALDVDSAQSFLDTIPIPAKFCYVIVETPEGSFCRDINGIYRQ